MVMACQRAGLLSLSTARAERVPCPTCGEGLLEAELPAPSREDLWVDCPWCGLQDIDPEQLQQWESHPRAWAAWLAHTLGAPTVPEESSWGCWSLGTLPLHGRYFRVFLSLPFPRAGTRDTETSCGTPTGPPRLVFHGPAVTSSLDEPHTLWIPLLDVLRLEHGGLHLDQTTLNGILESTLGPLATDRFVFRQCATGIWDIAFDGVRCLPLPDQKGFHYIRQLLGHPGQSLSAFQLIDLTSTPSPAKETRRQSPINTEPAEREFGAPDEADFDDSDSLDDEDDGVDSSLRGDHQNPIPNPGRVRAHDLPDAQAMAAYKKEAARLEDQLAAARRSGNDDRIRKLESDIHFLIREIRQGQRSSGRQVSADPNTKRAADAVRKAIRQAIDTLLSQHPALGFHLNRTLVESGHSNAYSPLNRVPWVIR